MTGGSAYTKRCALNRIFFLNIDEPLGGVLLVLLVLFSTSYAMLVGLLWALLYRRADEPEAEQDPFAPC